MKRETFHHGNLRAALLEKANQDLRQMGYDGVSMRGIAKHLGVTPRALYRHFENKDALLVELAVEGAKQLRARYQFASQLNASPRLRLHEACRAYLDFAAENQNLYELIFSDTMNWDDLNARVTDSDSGFELFEKLVGDVMGTDDATNIKEQSYTVWSILHGHALLRYSERASRMVEGLNTDETALKAIDRVI